jgi:hypothetical protein
MSIIPPAVLTVTQLVGSLVASAKNARELSKDSSNSDLKAAISDLYDEVLNVKAQVLDIDEENRTLKAELNSKDEIVGPVAPHGYFFYKDRLDQPLCPKCFQEKPQRFAFLTPPSHWNGGIRRTCKLCRGHIYEKEMVL